MGFELSYTELCALLRLFVHPTQSTSSPSYSCALLEYVECRHACHTSLFSSKLSQETQSFELSYTRIRGFELFYSAELCALLRLFCISQVDLLSSTTMCDHWNEEFWALCFLSISLSSIGLDVSALLPESNLNTIS